MALGDSLKKAALKAAAKAAVEIEQRSPEWKEQAKVMTAKAYIKGEEIATGAKKQVDEAVIEFKKNSK